MFSLTEERWLEGPKFPGKIDGPRTVPFDNTFLTLGGTIDGEKTSQIYQFDPEELKWIKKGRDF